MGGPGMRILFSSTWGVGHVFPMVPLARAFLAAGHQVRWVTNEPALPLVRDAGIDALPGGLDTAGVADVQSRLREATARMPGPERAAFAFPTMFGEWSAPLMAPDLLAAAEGFRPDVLIHEPAELASPLVGAVLGIPSCTHSWGGAIPPDQLSAAGHRLAGLWADHGLSVPPYAGSVSSTYLDICPPSGQPVALEHISVRRPLRPSGWSGLAGAARIEPEPGPLVYVTLGTLHNRSPAMEAAVAGVAAVARSGARVLVATGRDGDPGVFGALPRTVRVERWINQSEVLRHAAVVVSHAGSGTCLGAWANGLPQLCLPQAADQFRNAGVVASGGSGLTIAPDGATPDAIEQAVRRLLGEEPFRVAASKIAREITEMPDPTAVVRGWDDAVG